MSLEDANSYAQLVGIASSQDAGIQRVAAGNPNNSYLIQKMEGTAVVGGVMPPGGALPQPTIDIVRQWITDGAIDDRVQPSNPIQVSSLSPMSGANLTVAPTQIIAGFDRELDAASVNANTFILEASGGDMNFADGNEVQIAAASITVPGVNPQTAVFDLTGVVLADDTYRVRLRGLGAFIIMDLDANALDGEFSGVFPSGNGTAGGDFQAVFTLATPVVIGPTLDQIQAIVFTPTCAAVCHTGGLPAGGLDLSDADTSHLALVGAGGTGVPSPVTAILRVAPGDPDNSYLIQKLEQAMPVAGAQMPLGQAPLDPAVIAEIRKWIMDGALRYKIDL
ncbi:MAG: Ig-like domain-containing protein [Gammaproteobacteria bacterium]